MTQITSDVVPQNGAPANGAKERLPEGVTIVSSVIRVPITRIRPNPNQPREYFDEANLQRLAASMELVKQLSVIKVKRIYGDPDHDYEIVNGEQRWRAKQLNRAATMDCVTGEYSSEIEQFFDASICNVSGSGHTHREFMKTLQRVFSELEQLRKLPREERIQFLSAAYCRSVWTITNYLKLAKNLHPEVLPYLDPPTPKDERITFGTALKLCVVPLYDESDKRKDRPMLDDQVNLARTIREQGLRPQKAAKLIHEFLVEARKKGKLNTVDGKPRMGRMPGTTPKPSDGYRSLARTLERMDDDATKMLRIPVTDLAKAINAKPVAERKVVLEKFRSTIEQLTEFEKDLVAAVDLDE